MDYESQRSHKLGCWDGYAAATPVIDALTTNEATPGFEPDDGYCTFLVESGFGASCSQATRDFWFKTVKANYQGDDGRKRLRMCGINLRDRDGLHGRLADVKCPVMWLHGTADAVYSVANAKEEIEMFVNVPKDKRELRVVEGGAHFLSASHPKEVADAVVEFVGRYS